MEFECSCKCVNHGISKVVYTQYTSTASDQWTRRQYQISGRIDSKRSVDVFCRMINALRHGSSNCVNQSTE